MRAIRQVIFLMSLLVKTNPSIAKIYFQGNFDQASLRSLSVETSILNLTNRIINAPNTATRHVAILELYKSFKELYDSGIDKWENPKYHKYTITDHSLKAVDEAAKIINGKNADLDKYLTPVQKKELIACFEEKIDGIRKADLFLIAMAFHDLNKFLGAEPRVDKEGNPWKIDPSKHEVFLTDHKITSDQMYWTSKENNFRETMECMDKLASEMGLSVKATGYIKSVLKCHDYPLEYIIWPIQGGEQNPSKLFYKMKEDSELALKELAAVYLADQTAKGPEGWVNYLEQLCPWRCIFKSMMAERPLEELQILVRRKLG